MSRRAGRADGYVRAWPLLAGAMALAGCMTTQTGEDAASGAIAFRANCAGCHGARGVGDVPPGAPALDELSAANAGVFPAAYVLGVIEGHGRDPGFVAAMPEFGGAGMGSGPVVDVAGLAHPVPARTAGLLAYLEEIQK